MMRWRRAPHRNTNVGSSEGGGVVDAVADHDGHAVCDGVAHRFDLLFGGPLGEHPVDPERSTHRLCDPRVVAGEHRDGLEAFPAQCPNGERAVRPDLIFEHQTGQHIAVSRDEDGRPAAAGKPAPQRHRLGRRSSVL